MDPEGFQPAGPWHAFDRWYPPDTRPHKGPTGGEIDDLARADAQHGVHTGLNEPGKVGVGTQAPIGYQYIARLEDRVHLRHLGEIVREEGGDDPRQEHPGAGMEQPQQVCHRNATPRPLLGRLAERALESWHIGHRT
jgi:hypothetical protein